MEPIVRRLIHNSTEKRSTLDSLIDERKSFLLLVSENQNVLPKSCKKLKTVIWTEKREKKYNLKNQFHSRLITTYFMAASEVSTIKVIF